MPVQRLQPTSPQQQQMANMMARNAAGAQQRPYRTESADRVGVPSMNQLMSGIYGGGFNPYMGGGMGRGMGFGGMGRGMGGGFNPYMGGGMSRGMGFGGFNPYMGGGGMGFGGRGMGRGGFNPYMAQPQPMQLPDFARQMYGIGQRTNPYASMERIMPYVPPRQTGPEFGGITGNV